jgi:hypothetical protein
MCFCIFWLFVLKRLQNPSHVQVLYGGPGDAVGIDNYVKQVQLLLQCRTVVAITGAGNSVAYKCAWHVIAILTTHSVSIRLSLLSIGGMGKSTLARAVYKELLPQFTKGHAALVVMEDSTKKSTDKALSELLKALGFNGTNSVHLQQCLQRKSKPVLYC